MDDQQPTPSDEPGYQSKRERVAAHRVPPGGGEAVPEIPLDDDGQMGIELTPEPTAAEAGEPVASEHVFAASAPIVEETAAVAAPVRPTDGLPGDAAPTPVVEAPPSPAAGTTLMPNAVIIREPAAAATAEAVAPRARGGMYTLWMLIWVLAWGGAMSLTLNHRFDRKMDWNTSYFSVAARNLVREGFVHLRGGVFMNAGEFGVARQFYAGHPPMTAWLLAGWMKFMGQSDAAIRALPLAFTALNLVLLYALVRRTLGAPAALAATVFCSLLPMTAYYAQVVNMEPFVLTFILGASLGYLGWARSGSRFGFVVLCACVVLGCWTDWPMYIFTGLLAAAHFFRRRDLLPPVPPAPGVAAGEDVRPGPPVMGSLFLIVLTLAVFATFLAYMIANGAKVSELTDRATERMTAAPAGGGARTTLAGHGLLFSKFKNPKLLSDWFVGLFTAPALVLAAVGALLWGAWSRRLATGEAARRAAFKVLLCVVVTQLIYTLVFPEGAWRHEFWQYYLILPVAILAGAFCTWLTVAGGVGRGFTRGLVDRAAWAVAALIPLAAVGPFAYRMQIPVFGRAVESGNDRLDADYVGALRAGTGAGDVILTDWDEEGLGMAIRWYADRAFVPHTEGATEKDEYDTHSAAGIERARKAFAGRRILYLSSGGPDSKKVVDEVLAKYPRQTMGRAVVYEIEKGNPAGTRAAATTKATTRPATSAAH